MPLIFVVFLSILILPISAQAAEPSLWSQLVFYIQTQQTAFHRELAGAIRALQDGGIAALWGMVGISFMYGIFHAAGPGHGKAIIGTYLMSHESQLKRGIFLSFASAFVQGLSALVLVYGLVGIVGWSRRDAQDAVPFLEMLSFGLVAVIGLVLVYRAGRALWRMNRVRNNHHHGHNHTHDHHSHDHHHHDHDHAMEDCQVCGHSHAPDPQAFEKASSWRDQAAIIFSVGIRPCSGSVLVLIFAQVVGLAWAGVASVFAVSLGTAITVSALAIMAVYFRKAALSLSERQGSQTVQNISLSAAVLGGVVITALGISLLLEASRTSHPLF